ncbi:LamG-like jellyroll fold domain-containing protein [Paenibacillus harenae]|uniref:Fibronectin type 3 domain-containing protein n=1 Tax=Paenibacillus harenae TaxID=306543 RepID=A0ABT9UEZ9_PAEHA|nr:LamG-like jellyroll fold domain-containing protein [Paenibacillus harenae]MDQ0116799.1 fibronectin type 3 domain-containing protein [Paenibacillus harenae]
MNLSQMRALTKKVFSSILCFTLAMAFTGFGGIETANAAVSPLITSYKPQAVSADVNATYTDANGNTVSATIHHPGIAMSLADLDNMRDHVRAGDEPWNTAFGAFAGDRRSSKTPRIFYEEGRDVFVNIRGPWAATIDGIYYSNPSDYAGTRANTDSETAFHQAIMWYITGDETYRSNAIYIIRAYAGIQSVVPHTSFRFATMTYLLAAAAEILRYSDTQSESLKWNETDTQNFINMMELCSVTYNAHYFFMNQHQFTVMGTMARAIFTNDLELYAEAVEATTVNALGDDGGRNGSIKHEMRWMTKNEMTGEPLDPSDYHVQLMEMGRDVGHSYANIAGLSALAQTIYAQGTKVDPVDGTMSTAANAVNPFNFLDDRLLEGTTYALRYHLGHDVLWTPAVANQSYSGQIFDKIQTWGDRGRIDAFYSVLYNYYKYIEGQDMNQEKFKYLAYAYETRMPEVAGKDYPLATLLYTPDAAIADGMSNKITLGGITGLTATMAGPDAINLSWTSVSGALGYNIYRSTEENGTYTQITSAPITTTSYSDTGLTPNTIYYYKVGVSGGPTSGVLSATTGGTGVPAFDVSNYELNVNHTHQSVLRVIHPDRSSQVLTSQASLTSSNPAVATVGSAGLVTGISAGTATITATYNGQAYHATVKVIVDTDLKAWYKFDAFSGASAADASGYGNTGTVNGGAAWTTGQTGNAAALDGTNDYIALPAGIVSDADTITVAAWVNLDTVSNWTRIFDFGSGTSTYMYLSPKNGANGKIRIAIKNNNSSEQIIEGQSALPSGGWHHVAVTLNGGTGTLYVDGAQAGINTTMTIKPSDLGETTQNWIGRSQFPDPYLDGRVDDFRIYTRAISSSEVVSVMNGQTLETVTTAPTGVAATTADYSSINVSWSAVTGATGYYVYVADSLAENAVYTKANSDLITGTSYASLGLKANTTYYYKVTAVSAAGESSVSAIASATTGSMPDASLISWYKFDDTIGTKAADASGYGNNATINGGASWTAGQFGGAAELDGTDNYIALPAGSVSGADTITIAAWVKVDTASNWTRIFDFGSGTSTTMYLTPKNGANGKIRFAIKNNGSSEQIIDGTEALATGGWHHVAVTLNGSTGTLYVDGAQVGSNTSITIKPSDLGATTQNWIGRSQFSDPYLDGRVDDFRMYNEALPADEIASLAAPGLITWYKFDQTSGTAVVDASGDINNGTLNGGATWTAGMSGNAADLNGTNGYIALPSGIVSGAGTISIAAWVNLDSANNWTRIFDFGSGTSTNMFLTPKNGANGKIRFAIKNNGSSEKFIDGQSTLPTGGWHHVAVTLNGSTGTLYVDGLEAGSNTSMTLKPSDLGATTQNWIGRSQYTADPYLDGRVDDFRIYNQALSADEIAALQD